MITKMFCSTHYKITNSSDPSPKKTKEPGCRAFRYDNPVLTSNPYIYI